MSYDFEIPKGYETRMRVVEALHHLLQTDSFDAITAKAICREAGISRQTFYRLFQDKYAIANWYWEIQAQKYLAEIGRTLTWHEGRLALARFCEHERAFLKGTLFSNNDYNALGNFSMRFVSQEYHRTLTEVNGIPLTPLLDFQIEYWAFAASMRTRQWILDSKNLSAEAFVDLLDTCLPPELREAFDKPVLERRAREEGSRG